MDKIFTRVLFPIILFCCCINTTSAQQLELDGGKVDKSVSTKTNADDVASTRVIFYSNIKVNYKVNMGIAQEDIVSGVYNGMMVDTLYFFLNEMDCKRIIDVSAEGFMPASIEIIWMPKATYKYTVIDPSSGGSEYSHLLDSGNKASAEHKYEIAAGFYKQAMSAEGAPSDLSTVQEYIKVMEICNNNLNYAKRCLIAAKKLKDESGSSADLRKMKEYYEEALTAYNGIKAYMSDDRYDVIIGKIEEAKSSLPLVIEGIVEDAANTMNKLTGVKIYAMKSESDKSPQLLATTDDNGHFHLELSSSDQSTYKVLLFDPEEIKGFKKTKLLDLSTINDHTKVRVKIFK
ncbi:MAG: hypothetical protein SNG27_01635 [Rikenellaceae bacterium]